MNQNSAIDDNRRHTLLGVTDNVAAELRRLLVDPVSGALKCTAVISGMITASGTPTAGQVAIFSSASVLAGKTLTNGSNITITQDATTVTIAATSGGGDMLLAGIQEVTGAKTFDVNTLILKGSTSGTLTLNATAISGSSVITFPAATGTVALTSDIPSITGLATKALDNLASVAINVALIPGTAGALDFGSTAKPWASLWLAGTSGTPATNQFKITGASTGGLRTITLPDASGTVVLGGGTASGTNTGDNAANSSTMYIGTTAVALNRASAALVLTGITSIDGSSASCTGNAATVTTNANLTGPITSSGNATSLANKITKKAFDEVGATYAPASGSQTVALDCAANNIHIVTGNASGTAITFTVANVTNSQPFIVVINQGSGTVSTIAAWFAGISWCGGTPPTLTATLSKADTFGFVRTGSNTYIGYVVGQNA